MRAQRSEQQQARGGWRFLLRALGHRNYRLFFAGQSVSQIGTWLTRVATPTPVQQARNARVVQPRQQLHLALHAPIPP